MNVFDFDKTIYRTDSTVAFWKYCIKRKKSLLWLLPKQGFFGVLYGLKLIRRVQFKSEFFCFVKHIDAEQWAKDFWSDQEKNIMPWFATAHQAGDYVVSASPEFLLEPICEKLGMKLLATRADRKTGKITGENCRDQEKVVRLAEVGVTEWENAYSDSLSDTPILEVAKHGFLVDNQKGTVVPWKSEERS